jgi:hypothetical protein
LAVQLQNSFEHLCDLGEKRIAEMDAAGIDMQVLSLTSPGTEQLDASAAIALAREANDRVAEAVRSNPTRFAGFASLRPPILMPPSSRWIARFMSTVLREL